MLRGLATLLAGTAFMAAAGGAAPAPGAVANTLSPRNEDGACAALMGLTIVKGVTVVEAIAVPESALRISDDAVVPNLPAFCRVRAISKPTPDSQIRFELWLPRATAWNEKFLSTGEGGFAGRILYGGNGTDGALDGNLRRGYATASTDTGHDAADLHFAVGHPERGVDYLYRAKHLTTVAAKAIITAYFGRPPVRGGDPNDAASFTCKT